MERLYASDTFPTIPYAPPPDPALEQRILGFIDRHVGGLEPGWAKMEGEVHRNRLCQSLLWIAGLLRQQAVRRPLVLGDSCLFDWSLGEAGIFPWHLLTFTDFDLRYPFPLGDGEFDFVLATEVLEHLKDRHESDRAVFSFSGAKNAFSECFRVLAPGGRMFLTTPNACSRHAIARLLRREPPFEWTPHVREYAPGELMALVRHAGFVVAAFDTLDVYTHTPCPEVEALLGGAGDSLGELRGDTFFVVLHKPDREV